MELMTNAVRNEQGVWINSQVFREEGNHFTKNKYYCPHPKGSPSYRAYWDEQLNRCINGYTSGGVKITQHHYFYLNFTQINVAKETGGRTAKKLMKNPDFWDGDYNFYWALEIAKNGLFTDESLVPSTLAERNEYWELEKQRLHLLNEDIKFEGELIDNLLRENSDKRLALENKVLNRLQLYYTIEVDWRDGGHHVIVGKARRKGYSYKNAAICANIYNTTRDSITVIGAFDKKYLYPKGTMGMASKYLSFLNKNTAWTKAREFVDKQEHKRASFKEMREGAPVESGYMSEIIAVSFKDNPDVARGVDAKIVLLEEAGKFPNLKAGFRATYPGLQAGKYITGQIIIFGTGGDMESGTVDFADMFYHPKQDNLMPFINIWDDNAENSTCGFFHPTTWNMEGYYDEEGNSLITAATKAEKAIRKKKTDDSTDSGAIQQHVQEYPFNPSEAFLTVSHNDFPIIELRNQLNRVERENLNLKYGQAVHMFRAPLTEEEQRAENKRHAEFGGHRMTTKIVAKPDLDGELQPLWRYKIKSTDLRGAPVIYEYPVQNPPKGLYKIGFDPYRHINSGDGQPSLGAIYVYKASNKFSYSRNKIVAQYVGRPYSPDDVSRIAEMFAELYNAEVMFENEVTHVRDYFTRIKKLHLLAAQPDTVISKAVGKSTVARVYGCHMTEKLKDAGEKYIKQWLLEVRDYDEHGGKITNLDMIYDIGLLEELILYNRKGNFDRVMALMQVMFQLAEDEEGKTYEPPTENTVANDFLNMMQNQFKKN